MMFERNSARCYLNEDYRVIVCIWYMREEHLAVS